MKNGPIAEPDLQLIDALLCDLAVRSPMFVGRRSQDGDAETFVIQTGEEGRRRLRRPDLDSDESIEAVAAEAQAYVGQALGAPVPLCPLHEHALTASVRDGALRWTCPDGRWSCALGEYEELTWPQLDVESLASILSRRLHRRGIPPATVGVRRTKQGLLAEFGVREISPELIQALEAASAPLPIIVHVDRRGPIRVRPLAR